MLINSKTKSQVVRAIIGERPCKGAKAAAEKMVERIMEDGVVSTAEMTMAQWTQYMKEFDLP